MVKPGKPAWTDYNGEELSSDDITSDQVLLRLSMLWLLTICCYGTQVLLERQRVALVEAGEFAAREGQLRSAGRLAAEFAHQIKNPITVINNAAYSLKRSVGPEKTSAAQQIEIIQEEVARVDRVITQIMGYAQLSEGRVEKLDVLYELKRAIDQVFPAAVPSGIRIKQDLGNYFPPLLMQRGHLGEILVNLLQNAREALNGSGIVMIRAACRSDYSVEISIADNGPGIPPEKIGRIFEAYFTTKEKGTGLGLAIVKHNVELYDGTVRVESELGKGAKFTLVFPAKSLPKPFDK
jgi:signal transduction histidine kinase